jgi:RND family efflux transporter MFP subunit
LLVTVLVTAMLLVITPGVRGDVEGFTSPYREIDASAPVSGVIATVHVQEGDRVVAGQPLAELNQDVFRLSLEIAEKVKALRGQLESAQAEARLRKERLRNLEILRRENHASPEEVMRGTTEVEMSEAQLLAVQESLEVKALEYERAQAQLEERIIRSPIDGVVVELLKDECEYVSPTDPSIVKIVRLDPLLATFSVPSAVAESLARDDQVRLRVPSAREPVTGTVEFTSPVINAESGTVTVKVLLPNPEGRIRSGQKCTLITSAGGRK